MKYWTDSFPGRSVTIENKEYLYFGGTSYLGLQTDATFQDIFIKNTRIFGTNYGASRKSNVQISVFEKAENYLAELVGSEACITLSSGYLAGQLVSQFLSNSKHPFFYAPNTHSALYQHKIKTYDTFTALNTALRAQLSLDKESVPVVFLDSIDFSGMNYPNFDGLQLLPLDDIILVADDSHGIGIVGENGGGVYQKLKSFKPKELIVCCSLGKGYGVQGGAVFGFEKRIKALQKTAFFGGASPAAPVGLATFLDSEEIYTQKRITLSSNIKLFTEGLRELNKFQSMPEHPSFGFVNEALSSHLEKNHILITNFRYPDEDSKLLSRIIISAAHKKEDIQCLVGHLNTLSEN
ncbi:aminotransferase class I/II-fold pyridoxal phosphate-dependent enzyme [Flagellimonas sp. 389]|uniref:aminotransferase class I/II-fold pyridoxal phosphate-dependent enzyme n=1 Tax=Flagellimonas sp. 389 TaxID=2835862 RepID=UPI001BD303AF|nr:aminotransferase class I/II-fold pyridoxal phosphate-dependent enzyme [Flagellimonas sp. 389]MBS9464189.1 aminotransferase class I/II-fold pyridoxal phosphate-dependent enzyme [Flagellimonas sp. 389]